MTLGVSGLRSVPSPKGLVFAVGDKVIVEYDGRWYDAVVLEVVSATKWKIHYDGWEDSADEEVGPGRIGPF